MNIKINARKPGKIVAAAMAYARDEKGLVWAEMNEASKNGIILSEVRHNLVEVDGWGAGKFIPYDKWEIKVKANDAIYLKGLDAIAEALANDPVWSYLAPAAKAKAAKTRRDKGLA